jgi:calcium-dependent protein kinase
MVNEHEVQELRALFQQLDKNNDGQLSREELIEGYTQLLGSHTAALEETSRIMEQADTD